MNHDGVLRCRVPSEDLDRWKVLAGRMGLSKWVRSMLNGENLKEKPKGGKSKALPPIIKEVVDEIPVTLPDLTVEVTSPLEGVGDMPESVLAPEIETRVIECGVDYEVFTGEVIFKFGRTMYEVLRPDGTLTWSLIHGEKGERR